MIQWIGKIGHQNRDEDSVYHIVCLAKYRRVVFDDIVEEHLQANMFCDRIKI